MVSEVIIIWTSPHIECIPLYLTSFRAMSVRFIHVGVYISHLIFFITEPYFTVQIHYVLLIYSPIHGLSQFMNL